MQEKCVFSTENTFFFKNICVYQKKAVPLHSLSEESVYMVVLAQLAEHRIVVPSVVGSSPTFHPKCRCNRSYGGFVVDTDAARHIMI